VFDTSNEITNTMQTQTVSAISHQAAGRFRAESRGLRTGLEVGVPFWAGNFYASFNNFGLIGFSGFINTASGPQFHFTNKTNAPTTPLSA
jgi:hypothetical protein